MSVKLSRPVMIRYGVADFGANLVGVVANTWLLYYLINVARLPPLLAGLAFLAGRLFDALIDPAIGAWSDRERFRRGRLWFPRVFALPAGALFALLWLIPYADSGRFVLACLGFMALSALYSLATIPYLALGPELTPDYDQRTSLNSYRLACSMLATLVGVALPPLVVLGVTGARDLAASPAAGWVVVGALCAALITAAFLTTALGVREPPRTGAAPDASHALSMRAVREVLGTFGFPALLGVFLLTAVGFMVTNSLLPFYLESVLRLPAALQSPVLGALFGVAILGFPLWVWASARIGKRVGLLLGLGLVAASLLILVSLVPRGGLSGVLGLTLLLNGLGVSAVSLFTWSMLPDVIEFDELRSGLRREGLFYALLLLGLKVAGSLAVFSNALVTALLGYQAGQAAQSPETVRGLELMMGPVAAALFVGSALFAWRYPVTREAHTSVRAQLSGRAAPHGLDPNPPLCRSCRAFPPPPVPEPPACAAKESPMSRAIPTPVLRTPDERFRTLPGYPFAPHYIDDLPGYGGLRLHYLDEGPPGAAETFLCLHGEPTWSYLYRKMIPVFVQAGGRVVAPDLYGFGRSDKPADDETYTFDFHRGSLLALLGRLDLRNITLVVQDWGGLLGLTLPLEAPDRFSRVLLMNTALATGDLPPGPGFLDWRDHANAHPDLDVAGLLRQSCAGLSQAEAQAYAAPFPDVHHKAGVRRFPNLVPDRPDAPGAELSRRARAWWGQEWTGQSFMAVGRRDPVLGADAMADLRSLIRGCPPPLELEQAGHFVQEDAGEQIALAALRAFGLAPAGD